MKRKLLITTVLSIFALSLFTPVKGFAAVSKEVLLKESFEIKDDSFNKVGDEYASLKEKLQNKKIIAIGDNNLGVRETYMAKQNLTAYAIENLGFSTIVLDVAVGNTRMLNDYVLTGEGSYGVALSCLKHSDFNTEEFKAFVEWVKEYNSTKKENEKVRFYGRLEYEGQAAIDGLMNYLEKVDKETYDKYSVEAKKVDSLAYYETSDPRNCYDAIQQVNSIYRAKKDEYIKKSSKEEYEVTLTYMKLVVERAQIISDKYNKQTPKKSNYDINMEALKDILALSRDNKAIIWSTNMNLAESLTDTKGGASFNRFGKNLRETFKDDIFIIGTDVNTGEGVVKEFIYSNVINHEYDDSVVQRVKKSLPKNTNSIFDILGELKGNSNYIDLDKINEDLSINILAQNQSNIELTSFTVNATKSFDGFIVTNKGTTISHNSLVNKSKDEGGNDNLIKILIGGSILLILAFGAKGYLSKKKSPKAMEEEEDDDSFNDFD